jgi:hypothetical protein
MENQVQAPKKTNWGAIISLGIFITIFVGCWKMFDNKPKLDYEAMKQHDRLQNRKACSSCKGTGFYESGYKCTNCNGSGWDYGDNK